MGFFRFLIFLDYNHVMIFNYTTGYFCSISHGEQPMERDFLKFSIDLLADIKQKPLILEDVLLTLEKTDQNLFCAFFEEKEQLVKIFGSRFVENLIFNFLERHPGIDLSFDSSKLLIKVREYQYEIPFKRYQKLTKACGSGALKNIMLKLTPNDNNSIFIQKAPRLLEEIFTIKEIAPRVYAIFREEVEGFYNNNRFGLNDFLRLVENFNIRHPRSQLVIVSFEYLLTRVGQEHYEISFRDCLYFLNIVGRIAFAKAIDEFFQKNPRMQISGKVDQHHI